MVFLPNAFPVILSQGDMVNIFPERYATYSGLDDDGSSHGVSRIYGIVSHRAVLMATERATHSLQGA
jgi:hypothetical protein